MPYFLDLTRDDFESHALFDAARELWHATIMGKWLPPYGENAARAKAWGLACMRQRERAIAHKLTEERAVKVTQKTAAAVEADRSKCLDRSHHLFWAHTAGRHVLGEYVIS